VSLRATATGSTAAGSVVSWSVTIPASTQVGDVVLLAFGWSGTATVVSVLSSAGSTITNVLPATAYSAASQALYSIIAGASDPGSTVTITVSAATRGVAMAWVERDVVTTPEDADQAGAGTSGTAITVPSSTPSGQHPNDRHIIFYGLRELAAADEPVLTPPSGYVQRAFVDTTHATSTDAILAGADRDLASTDPTGTLTATASPAISPRAAMGVLLRPTTPPMGTVRVKAGGALVAKPIRVKRGGALV
jgi:hypothetical protein